MRQSGITLTILSLLQSIFLNILVNAQEQQPVKVSHAEPVYFDLIRDLGARKGEKEFNAGIGAVSQDKQLLHLLFVEYEFAPINRLGLEIEIPLSIRRSFNASDHTGESSGLEGIKLASQYSFFVSEKWKTTMAAGYLFKASIAGRHSHEHNPFIVVAKKWGRQFHSLVYCGPLFEQVKNHVSRSLLINFNVHYQLHASRNIIGLEVNEKVSSHSSIMMLRPQMKMSMSRKMSLGLVVGIPCSSNGPYLDFLARWIYEP